MFGGLIDDATSIIGDVAEVATLGVVESNTAKRLAKAGLTIAEIASELDVTIEVIKKVLKEE